VIVTTGGEAELGAVGGGVPSPEPLGDEEPPCVTPPPLVAAAVFEPLVQAVVSTATIAAEAVSRVIAVRRRFPPMGRTTDVRMKLKLLVNKFIPLPYPTPHLPARLH